MVTDTLSEKTDTTEAVPSGQSNQNNPSTFTGEKLPVENISWLDAVNFANAKSCH